MHHATNAKTLRARLLLQNGDAQGARECLRLDPKIPLLPSWRGEFLAVRAVALACLGDYEAAVATAETADRATITLEVRILAQTARAIASLDRATDHATALIQMATRSDVWDPVVCGVRSSSGLADIPQLKRRRARRLPSYIGEHTISQWPDEPVFACGLPHDRVMSYPNVKSRFLGRWLSVTETTTSRGRSISLTRRPRFTCDTSSRS